MCDMKRTKYCHTFFFIKINKRKHSWSGCVHHDRQWSKQECLAGLWEKKKKKTFLGKTWPQLVKAWREAVERHADQHEARPPRKNVILHLKGTAHHSHGSASVPWRQSNLFEERADCDHGRFEGWKVARLIVHGAETFRVPPGDLCPSVNAAGFAWGVKGAGRVRERARWWVETWSDSSLQLNTSSWAVRVGHVTVQHGCRDDLHDVHSGPGEGHPVATQPLAERLGLTSQLLQLVLVLGDKWLVRAKNAFLKSEVRNICRFWKRNSDIKWW